MFTKFTYYNLSFLYSTDDKNAAQWRQPQLYVYTTERWLVRCRSPGPRCRGTSRVATRSPLSRACSAALAAVVPSIRCGRSIIISRFCSISIYDFFVWQCCVSCCARATNFVPRRSATALPPLHTAHALGSSALTGYVEPVGRRRHEHCDLRGVAVVVRTERRVCDLYLGQCTRVCTLVRRRSLFDGFLFAAVTRSSLYL